MKEKALGEMADKQTAEAMKVLFLECSNSKG